MIQRVRLTIVLIPAFAASAVAQRPDSVTGEIHRTFREVTAVKELPDGRALVLDSHERFVYLADFRTGNTQVIGEQGWGDRQYLWPSRLLHVAADTTLVWDAIEGRLHVLDWAGGVPGIRRSMPKSAFGPPNLSFSPVMSDDGGRMYSDVSGGEGSILLRWNPGDPRADTVLRFQRARLDGLFSVWDRWTVSSSGVVAYVHVSPYRVDFSSPGTTTVAGKPIPFDPIPVTPAIQRAWLQVLQEPHIVWAQTGGQPPRFEERAGSWVEYGAWPLVLPAIVGRMPFIQFASDGSLLIERMAMPDLPSQYDVIDAQAVLKDRFELPAGTRIVGTGRNVVYLGVRGLDGRVTLQRFTVRGSR